MTIDGDYVFVPVVSDRDWRPYREGHWVYARGYGWTWVSDEPFGWATYHYGRWGFDEEIGWYWVPGTALGSGMGKLAPQRRPRGLGSLAAVPG